MSLSQQPATASATQGRTLRAVRDGEEGLGLVEVMVSAMLLVLVAVGVLSGIDGPGSTSGQNKSRSIAAALAQQDQNRLRAFKVSDISNYNATRTVAVGGIAYTVKSRAAWISDSTGTESCSNNSSQTNYLKISSTASWPNIGSGAPVTVASLMSPPPGGVGANTGNLSVQLLDQAGSPVTGVPVTLTSGGGSVPTNSVGCAFFGYLAVGTYAASFAQPGWVDPSGTSNVTLPNGSVTAGATNTLSGSYAQAAQTAVSFDSKLGANAPAPVQADSVSLANPGVPPPGWRTFSPQGGGVASTITATNLFPFTSGYGVYAGTCQANNPVTYIPNYFTQNPRSYATLVPGASASMTVREPALSVLVQRSGLALQNAHVVVTESDAGCTTRKLTFTTNATGAMVNAASGAPSTVPAAPFGSYTVCADDGQRWFRTGTGAVTNTNPNGSAPITLNVPSSGNSGVCA